MTKVILLSIAAGIGIGVLAWTAVLLKRAAHAVFSALLDDCAVETR